MVELYRLRREHPQYVERYIAGTSDMFRKFIDDGLAQLDAAGGVSPAATAAAAGMYGSTTTSTPTAVPRISIPPAGGMGANTSPNPGSARSDGSQSRLSNLKDRLSHIKSTEGGGGGGGGGGGVQQQQHSPVAWTNGGRGGGAAAASQSSVEELTARLQSLRRGQA